MILLDIRNIFVIVAYGYTEEEVIEILKEDGYIHNFLMGSRFTREQRQTWKDMMAKCDEVWSFGNPRLTFEEFKWQYSHAIDMGYEIWRMG